MLVGMLDMFKIQVVLGKPDDDAGGDVGHVQDASCPRQAWVPNIFIYNLVSFSPLVCLEVSPKRCLQPKIFVGLWMVKIKIIIDITKKRSIRN